MSERVRVLLADDHALVRAGVRKVLEAEPGIEVVGEAGDGDAGAERCCARASGRRAGARPQHAGPRRLRGAARAARAPGRALRMLVLTLHDDAEYVARAVREGADGYLLKDCAVQDLPGAIRAVMAGRGVLQPARAGGAHRGGARRRDPVEA